MRTHRHRRTTLTTITLVTLLAAGCTAAPTVPGGPTTGVDAESSPASTTPPPVTPSPQEVCFNPHGGKCLGDLAPGSYETTIFEPALRYEVGGGWVNAEDLPGNFALHREADPQDGLFGGSYIGVFTGVRVPMACEEAWDETIDDSPDAMLRWYLEHPGLEVTGQREVTVGGLDGTAIDLVLAEDYREDCPWSEGHPTVPLIIGNGVSQLHHTILPGMGIRLVMLDWEESNVTIEITNVSEQHSFEEYIELTKPIVESFTFGG